MKGWRIKSLNRKFELSRKILQELRMLFKLFSCCLTIILPGFVGQNCHQCQHFHNSHGIYYLFVHNHCLMKLSLSLYWCFLFSSLALSGCFHIGCIFVIVLVFVFVFVFVHIGCIFVVVFVLVFVFVFVRTAENISGCWMDGVSRMLWFFKAWYSWYFVREQRKVLVFAHRIDNQ